MIRRNLFFLEKFSWHGDIARAGTRIVSFRLEKPKRRGIVKDGLKRLLESKLGVSVGEGEVCFNGVRAILPENWEEAALKGKEVACEVVPEMRLRIWSVTEAAKVMRGVKVKPRMRVKDGYYDGWKETRLDWLDYDNFLAGLLGMGVPGLASELVSFKKGGDPMSLLPLRAERGEMQMLWHGHWLSLFKSSKVWGLGEAPEFSSLTPKLKQKTLTAILSWA